MRLFNWRRRSSKQPARSDLPLRWRRPTIEALEERNAVSVIYGITPGNVLIRFDSASPGQVTTIGAVSGLGSNETIRGIDFRPRTGQLYASTVATGSAANSVITTYTINPLNAQATLVGATAAALAGAGDVPTGYDFNPTVDLIRYVNTNDENARLNPNSGGLQGNDTDLTPAATSTVIAEAYDRNFDRQVIASPPNNAIPTTLYAIDRNDSQLSIQGGINGVPSPNGGVITDLAPLGFTLNQANDGGFDITAGAGSGRGFAALTDDADDLTRLYSINLVTALQAGAVATSLGLIGNGQAEVRSISVVPDSTVVVGSGAGPAGDVRVYDGFTRALKQAFVPFGPFAGGVRVASGDVTGDGVVDVIVGAGPGANGGHVKVFDGVSGATVRSFFSFDPYAGGVNVAAGDVNADGFDDVVVGAEANSHVKVFNGRDGALLASFLAFPGFTGGVSVAAADFDLDGDAELVVGASTLHFGGHVKIFNGQTGQLFTPTPPAGAPAVNIPNSFLTFPGFFGGISVAAGDVNGDGSPDVIVGAGPGAPGGHVKVFSARVADPNAPIGSFFSLGPTNTSGVNVAVADANADGLFEIRAASGPGAPGQVGTFNFLGQPIVDVFAPFGGFAGGIFIGGSRSI
jgi:hypothetical protein